MQQLIKEIEDLRARLPRLRREQLKETPTRSKVINPLLRALGWDVLDQEEAEEPLDLPRSTSYDGG
ncbi:MAG TPA: hypothetical protein PKK06_08475 [Phycisphaerae bacterium]|nr:hypothetical protein [Phycisphaerae bacterium]HNU45255.1 hypothetical protein [Phycisphaerae bacterium]